MHNNQSAEASHVLTYEILRSRRRATRRRQQEDNHDIVGPWSYRAKVGRATIRLASVEYRILSLLASRPYHAFSRRRIAEAVSTQRHPVTAETLGRYVTSLRTQLGFFGNYIQSVPYIGYRFKA